MSDNLYNNCRLCPRNCGVDRRYVTGYCGMPDMIMAARAGLHFYEEPFLSGMRGSGTVFFSGCSLGCIYCQNGQISRDHFGIEISTERLGQIFLEQQERGAHNINLVTGTHYIPSIAAALEKAKDKGLGIPVIWNSSGYEKTEYLKMLEGLVDIFMPDYKTMSAELAERYMNAPDYPEVAKEALNCMKEMAGDPVFEKECCTKEQSGTSTDRKEIPDPSTDTKNLQTSDPEEGTLMKKGMIVRHLVIPGHTRDSKDVLHYLNNAFGNHIWISLMSQYTPCGEFDSRINGADDKMISRMRNDHPELCRTLSVREYKKVVDYAINEGIENCMIQEGTVASDSFIPVFDGTGIRII